MAAQMPSSDAVSAALRLSSPWAPAQLILAVFVVLGVAAALRWRTGRGLLAVYLIFLVAYISVLAEFAPIAAHTGLWYGQWYRLFGVLGVWRRWLRGQESSWWCVASTGSGMRSTRAIRTAAIAGLVAALVGGLSTARYLLCNEGTLQATWDLTTVTDEDRAFFGEVDSMVGGSRCSISGRTARPGCTRCRT